MKRHVQPRLDADVAKMVSYWAKVNSRTVPREVNHTLRERYRIVPLSTERGCTGIDAPAFPLRTGGAIEI